MKGFYCTILLLVLLPPAYAEPITVSKGRPIIKISEGGISRIPNSLEYSEATNLECVVSKIGDDYFGASRENTPLVRIESGAFITFLAINGSGYVRVLKESHKDAASLMSVTEKQFDYAEHLLIGLRSVTYYGTYPH